MRVLLMMSTLAWLASCNSSDAPPAGPDGAGEDASPLAAECEGVAFPQSEACRGDDSVEFCIAANDDELFAELQGLAPSLRVVGAFGGRAGCDTDTQVLVFYPTPHPASQPGTCVLDDGAELPRAMTDAAWAEICALGAHPGTSDIVYTFYE